MSDEKRCEWCVHYAVRWTDKAPYALCALDRPLIPCEFYGLNINIIEREPGSDDDRGINHG